MSLADFEECVHESKAHTLQLHAKRRDVFFEEEDFPTPVLKRQRNYDSSMREEFDQDSWSPLMDCPHSPYSPSSPLGPRGSRHEPWGPTTLDSSPGRQDATDSVDWEHKPGYSDESDEMRVKVLHPTRMNNKILQMEYAVRGIVERRAKEIEKTLADDPCSYPFEHVVYCNLGNPQSLGQPPLTFAAQVLALTSCPSLIAQATKVLLHGTEAAALLIEELFASDAVQRARAIVGETAGGLGAYTHCQGIPYVRGSVANFIERRDGFESDADNIFLTNGATEGIQKVMSLISRSSLDAFLLPSPQYPLYSATVTELGAKIINYNLDEDNDWGMNIEDLAECVAKARASGIQPRALVVVNPGNPTGQCLTVDNMRQVVAFCERERLMLLADEVYQNNVYGSTPFCSFKRVVVEMNSHLELFSFHSTSKGVFGECGRRGGYVECVNIHPKCLEQLYKLVSLIGCPNTTGQVMVNIMCAPPIPGDKSYAKYHQETEAIYNSLRRRAEMVTKTFNELQGVVCNACTGALYAFPRFNMTPSADAAAQRAGMSIDLFYCLELLEATGVVLVPGSGFLLGKGKKQNVFYLRTTILPAEGHIQRVLDKFAIFHKSFVRKYP